MDVLLDTHVLLWTLAQSDRLSREAIDIIGNAGNTVYASVATFWEIAIKHAKRPQDMLLSGAQVAEMAREATIAVLDIREAHVKTLETLVQVEESTHKDPFDRILIAQAKSEGMSFLTHNSKMSDYEEPCIVIV